MGRAVSKSQQKSAGFALSDEPHHPAPAGKTKQTQARTVFLPLVSPRRCNRTTGVLVGLVGMVPTARKPQGSKFFATRLQQGPTCWRWVFGTQLLAALLVPAKGRRTRHKAAGALFMVRSHEATQTANKATHSRCWWPCCTVSFHGLRRPGRTANLNKS
jgi:hypothetical protein